MPNIKLLQEAIQAFASGETKAADAKMRKFFVEQAQEINKKFDEAFDGDGQEDLLDDIRYDMDDQDESQEVQFDDGKGWDGWEAQDENIPVREAEDEDEFESDVEVETPAGEDEVSVDAEVESGEAEDKGTWTAIQGAFEELAELFKELDGKSDDEFEDEEEISVSDEDGSDDEFSDIDFGSDVKESAAGRLKKVASPAMKEEGGVNDKSPVAKRAPAFVDGVSEVKIKDGTVDLKTTEDKMTDVDVTDNDNTMDNAKSLMKNVKEPKNSATTSKSPVAKRK